MLDTQTPASHHGARSLIRLKRVNPHSHSSLRRLLRLSHAGKLAAERLLKLGDDGVVGNGLAALVLIHDLRLHVQLLPKQKGGAQVSSAYRSAARTPPHYRRCSTHRSQLLLRDTLGVASLLQRQLQLRRHLRICPGMSAGVSTHEHRRLRHERRGGHGPSTRVQRATRPRKTPPTTRAERGDGAQILQGLGGFRQWGLWRRRTRALPGVVV